MASMSKLRDASKALAPIGLTTLRVIVGFILFMHGLQKAADYPAWERGLESIGIAAPEVFAPIAMMAELGGGALLMIGLFTPIAAAGILISMLVAIVAVHLPYGLMAQNNGFEYPLTLAAVAFYFMLRGAGPLSVDRLLFVRRARKDRDDLFVPRREAHI
jgi:putative oxidoreductase